MINKLKDFRLQSWHFGVAFVIVLLLTNAIAYIGFGEEGDNQSEKLKAEDDIGSETNFVLFYTEGSKPCKIMERNMYRATKSITDTSSVKFNKIDIIKHPEMYEKYNISGVPSILIFKDGEEINRITGVVSESNLKFIYRRVSKKNDQTS